MRLVTHDLRARRALIAAVATSVAACGLQVVGDGRSEPEPEDAGVEAGAPPEATPPQRGEGILCDPYDPTLLLCVPFEGDITDESAHRHVVRVDGGATFVPGVTGSAVAVDGGTFILVPQTPAMQTYDELTIEMWMRARQLPLDGGRAGLADRNGSFGFFLQANGDLTCTPGTARASFDAGSTWRHAACVVGRGTTTIYVDGVPLAESEAGPAVPTDEPVVIGSNSPSGDPFVGELDSVRIYTRAKLAAEVAAAADAGAE